MRTWDELRSNHSDLQHSALNEVDPRWQGDPTVPMLTKRGFILERPVAIESIKIEWDERSIYPSGNQIELARRKARRLLPRMADGRRFRGYSSALINLCGMSDLFNGLVYRPTKMEAAEEAIVLRFVPGRYFDFLDTTEVLSLEAQRCKSFGRLNGKYRRFLQDPFDLDRRSTSLGILVLTIRQSTEGCGFLMHLRDNNRTLVAAAPEVFHVIPAGEFTPSDVGLQALRDDFELRRTIFREYAEEFLGIEEAYGRGGKPIDYQNDFPMKELSAAAESGSLKIFTFGVGLDPLTWKTEVLAVAIFAADTFDTIFGQLVKRDAEGTVLVGPSGNGIPFTGENVLNYSANPRTRSGAKACLLLTWRHRERLGLQSPHVNT
jgi:hypothetical protein